MKDINIKYTRGSGPGGQHKNKVETCVVITHIPTGIVERCQETRSRNQNLKLAKERLQKKLIIAKQNELLKLKKIIRDERIANSKVIRTYNFPRREVIDHRSKRKADLRKVLDGELNLIR